jgi:hypothetical protein
VKSTPSPPRQLNPIQVLVRFSLRLAVLTGFAVFGSIGFVRSLAALLWMSIVLCAVVAIMRREPPLAASLNHWDEMAGFGALFALVVAMNQPL